MSDTHTPGVAFFDVDETLLSVRTLESFLLHYLRDVPSMASPNRLRELAAQVVELDRTAFNRLYFSLWAGQPTEQVRAAGRRWYAEQSVQPDFFRPNVLQRLRQHQRHGDDVVLVSGSFDAPLLPLADAVHAACLYCTRLATDDGRYTGLISAPMIGDDKRHAVEEYLSPREPITSWGYGDHPSDLPLLEAVTIPVVVGPDPILTAQAEDRGWEILPIEGELAPRTAPPARRPRSEENESL